MPMVVWISGLGADARMLAFLRVRASRQRVLDFIPPVLPSEPLASYAGRMLTEMRRFTPPEEAIVVGYSFGGILAVEMAKQAPLRKVVLLSSLKTRDELPNMLQLMRTLPVHRSLPGSVMKRLNQATANYFFGVKTREESDLLHQVIEDQDPDFVAWAVHEIINWQNEDVPEGLVHIHGTDDRILSGENIDRALWVEGGGHLMLIQRAAHISAMLNDALGNIP